MNRMIPWQCIVYQIVRSDFMPHRVRFLNEGILFAILQTRTPTNTLFYYANRLMNMADLGVIGEPEGAVEGLTLADIQVVAVLS